MSLRGTSSRASGWLPWTGRLRRRVQHAVLAHARRSSRGRAGPDTGAAGAPAAAGPDLTRSLRSGGPWSWLRHAATDFSKPDRDLVVVADCATQRNLSAQGRADARAIGRGVRRLGLRIGKVLEPVRRTPETALASGRATVHPAPQHDRRRARRALEKADPRRQAAARHRAGRRDADRARHARHRRAGDDRPVPRGGRGDRVPPARAEPLPRRRPRDAARVGIARRPASVGATRPRVREYPVPPGTHPHDVAPAPDGTVWYTAQSTASSAGSTRRPGGRRRCSSATAPRRTA